MTTTLEVEEPAPTWSLLTSATKEDDRLTAGGLFPERSRDSVGNGGQDGFHEQVGLVLYFAITLLKCYTIMTA